MGQLRRVIASLSLVAILSTLVITTTAFAAYKDVPESHWFAQYVDTLGELGVIDTTKDNFSTEFGNRAKREKAPKFEKGKQKTPKEAQPD